MVEMLTSMVFIAWLSAMSYAFTRTALVNARAQETRRGMEQAAVLAVDVLLRELRMAGFSAAGEVLPAVQAATPERVEVAADFNGDGDIDDANERIMYAYDGSKRSVMRATGGGSPQPFVPDVPPGGFFLRYSTKDGSALPTDADGLDANERAMIAAVGLRLQIDAPASAFKGNGRPVALDGTVALRNR
jgi:hypothetical protein